MFRTQSTLDFSVAEHYGLRNTTCWRSKDVASGQPEKDYLCTGTVEVVNIKTTIQRYGTETGRAATIFLSQRQSKIWFGFGSKQWILRRS
jgi:hypothetical protein